LSLRVSQALCQEDRLQLIAEKRKWQTEIENKKRQLEDDRRALQHLKSKALRERWLLDGQEQDEVKRQLEQDEAKTRSLEDTINRLEQELVSLETGSVCQTITHTTVTMYSVEIKVERDRLTGETRVLSTNTTLPVDLSHQGVKVYEDEQKVVHEMNGEDGIHLLSSSEVEELIHKADEASMMSQTVATVTSLPTVEVQEEVKPETPPSEPARVAGEITGLEAKPGGEPSVAEASAENPVTMVFMGYQSVEDEAETKKVLGLQGTVTAELVLIDDANALPPPASPDPPPTTKPPVAIPASNGETAGEVAGEVERGAVEVKKEKQLCKCCSIM
uniref:Paralemmin-1 n=1 Tax=Seriola dumerili TaxID=41447 RepID=A0A3B4USC6_SERDU